MIDIHNHLEYMADPEQVLLEARKRHMKAIITSIPDPKDIGKVLHLKEKYPTFFYLCLGFHPNGIEEYSDEEIDKYIDSFQNEQYDIVGIGEIGLEYTNDMLAEDKDRMKATFEKFIELAKIMRLPIVIHIRGEAFKDVFDILERHQHRDVVLHCFSGSESDLQRALKNNYWISYATNVCFTKKHPRLASKTPLDRMMLETDAPWLDPDQNLRGKVVSSPQELTNRPWNIEKSAEVIAKLHNTTKEEVLKITTHNAKKVFGIA